MHNILLFLHNKITNKVEHSTREAPELTLLSVFVDYHGYHNQQHEDGDHSETGHQTWTVGGEVSVRHIPTQRSYGAEFLKYIFL